MENCTTVQEASGVTKFVEWIHNHSLDIRFARYILDTVGAIFILVGSIGIESSALPIAIVGAIMIIAVEVGLFVLDFLGILAIDPSHHAYKEEEINASHLAYDEDYPILKIRADSPYQAGYDHGYLTAYQILSACRRMKILSVLGYLKIDSELYEKLETTKQMIPEEYLNELNGLVDGVNAKLSKSSWWPGGWSSSITLEEALHLHLLPDMMHLALSPPAFLFGCSAVIAKDDESNTIGIARNLDWPGMGLGKMTLLKDIKIKGQKQRIEPTMPGVIGVITGMNKNLFVSINVSEPKAPVQDVTQGIPSLFFNRMILEQCDTVEEAKNFIDLNSAEKRPSVPYHLLIADDHEAIFYHFFQGENSETFTRSYDSKDEPLFTLNCRHTSSEEYQEPNTLYYGPLRYNNIQAVWQEYSTKSTKEKLLHAATAAGVNNPMTVHSVIKYNRELMVGFDNSFAASRPLKSFSIDDFFSDDEPELLNEN